MEWCEITVRVDSSAAKFYLAASEPERRKLDALLSLRLSEIAMTARPLREIILDASREAKASGLTSELLQEILGGD
jgi:hypothetical protein